jgi:hypothetical protein
VLERPVKATVLAVLAIGLASCGGSSSSTTTHASAAQATSATTSSSSTAATGASSLTSSAPATSTTSSTSRTASSPPASHTTTAPPPTPAGTPTAPDGLRPTAGYATYELCSSQCSGGVPDSLRRALHLPQLGPGASCPSSTPTGPVKPLGGTQVTLAPFIASSWRGARVTWLASSSYQGPVLIRGRRLGATGAVGFGEGHLPYDELQLLTPGVATPRGTGREWPSFTRLKAPGCYAYQVDGTSFSEVVVFRAAG